MVTQKLYKLKHNLIYVKCFGIIFLGFLKLCIPKHTENHPKFAPTDRPRSGKPRKTMPQEDRVLTRSSRRNRFLSSRKLGRLLRHATGTSVWNRTVRNRLHAARLKACRPYVGIALT